VRIDVLDGVLAFEKVAAEPIPPEPEKVTA
jgi:hypothetical protein